MTTLFKKLNFNNHASIVVINQPASFNENLKEMEGIVPIITNVKKAKEIFFVMVFATTQAEVDTSIKTIFPLLKGDAVCWYCYPKGTSKKYKCNFNRDTGWAALGKLGLETVRQVAIDEDWSALRFRKVEFVKTITRKESYAITNEAKKRTTQKGK
jgi:hypothetical protein